MILHSGPLWPRRRCFEAIWRRRKCYRHDLTTSNASAGLSFRKARCRDWRTARVSLEKRRLCARDLAEKPGDRRGHHQQGPRRPWLRSPGRIQPFSQRSPNLFARQYDILTPHVPRGCHATSPPFLYHLDSHRPRQPCLAQTRITPVQYQLGRSRPRH